METKSTNEVKGDYDRVSASECLGSLIELHGIVMEDDLFVIPDADGTAVLYNDGKIRFDEIADIEVGSVFVGILLRNGYLFYLSRTEPLKTCIYTHGGWGSISEISPRGIAGHIGRELAREAGRPYGGRLTGNKKIGRLSSDFFSRRIFTAVACRVPVSAFAGRAVAATCRHGFPPRYAPRASGRDLRGTPGIGVPPLLSRNGYFRSRDVFNLCFHSCPVFLVRTNCPGNFLPRARKFRSCRFQRRNFLASHIPENSPSSR